jgi:hypothetical protein
MHRSSVVFASIVLGSALAAGQISAPSSVPQQTSPQNAQMAPMAYSNSQSLDQLLQTAQSTVLNLQKVRIDKWKTDDRYKDQARGNSESLQRNLTAALPTLVQQVRVNPNSLAASVKLYRNLNALYDVLESFTESTGAFGSKEDYNALARDTGNLENVRRNIADQLEQQAAALDGQVSRLTAQVQSQQQQAATAPVPTHVVVDDNAAVSKKPATKKKPVPKPAPKPAATPQAQ